MLSRSIKTFVQKNWLLRESLRLLRTRQIVLLEYPVKSRPRYGHGHPPHAELYDIIASGRATYADWLRRFLAFREQFLQIAVHARPDAEEPAWVNGYLPRPDAVALYGLLATSNPRRYFEVGSGYSTKFARRAIRDHRLQTAITSIDPQPRAEIDALADTVIRQPLETIDTGCFGELEAGNILFFDGSHRCFMNSDVTVFFLEVLPRLKAGVLVHIHDIVLPCDYPPEYVNRYYSEQYLLAAYLQARGTAFEIILPNAFIADDPELRDILAPLWRDLDFRDVRGCSFWIRKT